MNNILYKIQKYIHDDYGILITKKPFIKAKEVICKIFSFLIYLVGILGLIGLTGLLTMSLLVLIIISPLGAILYFGIEIGLISYYFISNKEKNYES